MAINLYGFADEQVSDIHFGSAEALTDLLAIPLSSAWFISEGNDLCDGGMLHTI